MGREETELARRKAEESNASEAGSCSISLIEFEDAVFFVRWETAGRFTACRPVRLDNQGRIIFNVGFMVKVITPTSHRMIIKNTSAYMLKSTARFRADMPGWCLVMRDLAEALQVRGPIADATCAFCKVCEQEGVEPVLRPGSFQYEPVYRCSRCIVQWHHTCAVGMRRGDSDIDWSLFVCPCCLIDLAC